MKKGKKVRVKPANEGEGFAVIVHPHNEHKHRLACHKGKGYEMCLGEEELHHNKEHVHHLGGHGIYDNIKKVAKAGYNAVSYGAKHFAPVLESGANYGIDMGLDALGAEYPQYKALLEKAKPVVKSGAKHLIQKVGNTPMREEAGASFTRGETNIGGSKAPKTNSLQELARQADAIHAMGKESGSDLGNRMMSGLANTMANQQNAMDTDVEVSKRKVANVKPTSRFSVQADEGSMGRGLTAGGGGLGLYAGRQTSSMGGSLRHHSSKHAIVGTHGGFMSGGSMNPALVSQPFSSHFAWKNRLPPAYQRYTV